ncbi:hypothetical protein [Streptomyces mirabilis]|uniref:hypothetical protein n=1 Tax=Streptomyces mirabilis TaxID=68239 RepID=UPI0036574EB6
MATVEQVAVPPQDGVGAYQQQEMPQFRCREVVEQAGKDRAVGVGEHGPADLALQDEQLVPERKDLDIFIAIAHRQQAQERQGIGRSEVGQAQQHDRS